MRKPIGQVVMAGLFALSLGSWTGEFFIPNGSAHAQTHSNSHESQPGESKLNVAVLLYDGALLLDYGISAEMFLAADFMRKFHVFTVARDPEVAVSILGKTRVDYTFPNAPRADVIIVPGGPTWQTEGSNQKTQEFLRNALSDSTTLFSICTGAMLLGKAGLLENRHVTTNRQAVPALRSMVTSAKVADDRDFVDDGTIVSSAGAGTAIDATLHLIERLSNAKIARDLARRYLDYPHYGQ